MTYAREKRKESDKMKKITSLIVAIMIMATMVVAPLQVSAAVDESGNTATTGTEADPILIGTAEELTYYAKKTNTTDTVPNSDPALAYSAASYKLTADIDMTDVTDWEPIGWQYPMWDATNSKKVETSPFTGTFDGDSHKVYNLTFDIADTEKTTKMSNYLGFFGHTDNATIKNLGLDNVTITFKNHDYYYDPNDQSNGSKRQRTNMTGGLVGGATNTEITNCYVINSTVANTRKDCNDRTLGGLVGQANNVTAIKNCYVYNTVIAGGQNNTQGGIVGEALTSAVTISNCYTARVKDGSAMTSHPDCITTTYGVAYAPEGVSTASVGCYSTMHDLQGTFAAANGSAKVYDAEESVGETALIEKVLIDKVLATGVYEIKEGVQDGFPVLKKIETEVVSKEPSLGDGTTYPADTYVIKTAGELKWATEYVNSGNDTAKFVLDADIDYLGKEWMPIGHYTNVKDNGDGTYAETTNYYQFKGTFDGNNHVVKNLKITNTAVHTFHYNYCGFFGYTNNATIKNLGIENMNIAVYNGNNPVKKERIKGLGGFVGQAEGGTFENCFVRDSSVKNLQGDLSGPNVGAFSSYMKNVTVKNAYVYNTKIMSSYNNILAGFSGIIEGGSFANCYADSIYDATGTTSSHQNIKRTQYGFAAKAGTADIAYENCYSTFETTEPVWTHNDVYPGSSDKTPGAEVRNTPLPQFNGNGVGLDKTDIITNFANVSGFKIIAELNDGMPSLAAEEVPSSAVAADVVLKSVTKAIDTYVRGGGSNGDGTGTGNSTTPFTYDWTNNSALIIKAEKNVDIPATMYVTSYDRYGRLMDVKALSLSDGENTFTADLNYGGAPYIKVFIWGDGYKPVVDLYQASVNTALYRYSNVLTLTPVTTTEFDEPPTALEQLNPTPQAEGTQLFCIGDSLGDDVWRNYGRNPENPESTDDADMIASRGWTGFVGSFLDENVEVVSHAHGGNTIQMFMEGRKVGVNTNKWPLHDDQGMCTWAAMKPEIGEGDYVAILLGTNDNARLQGTRFDDNDGAFTGETNGQYWARLHEDKQYDSTDFLNWYSEIIDHAIAQGAKVIIMNPPATYSSLSADKKSFVMTDNQFNYSRPAIQAVVDKYAENENVAFVDISNVFTKALNDYSVLTGKTPVEMAATYSHGSAEKYKYTAGLMYTDWCHFTEEGARLLAHTIAKGMINSGIGL